MTREDYIAKYGEKDGLRRWKESECKKRWRLKNPEYSKQYYQEHREERAEYNKQYNLEHCKEKLEYNKQYRQEHRGERVEYSKQYYQGHREKVLERGKRWNQTPYGRAYRLISSYRQKDRRYNRGECTLTPQWVVDNIFSKRCLYCGESDWRKLGIDRIDNARAHTPNNVVCCCGECNKKRQKMDFLEFAYSIGAKDSDGLIIKY